MSEVDAMICRVCGKEERASEGYPCDDCGDFICLICSFDGLTRCKSCVERAPAPAAPTVPSADEGGEDAAVTPPGVDTDERPVSTGEPGESRPNDHDQSGEPGT